MLALTLSALSDRIWVEKGLLPLVCLDHNVRARVQVDAVRRLRRKAVVGPERRRVRPGLGCRGQARAVREL